MKYLMILLLLTGILISGCGVQFADAPVNQELPESLVKRALYPAGVSIYEAQDLVGNILLIREGKDPLRIGLIRPDAYKTEIKVIEDSYNYYKSRIQKGAEVKGSYLTFAADFKADQMAELELFDFARAGVTFDVVSDFEEILTKLRSFVSNSPKIDTSINRLWVKSVVVTKRIYNEFTKIDANANGQVGDVVGVSTGVYNKTENAIKSGIIAFEAFDIDELVKQSIYADTLKTLTKKTFTEAFDKSNFSEQIEGRIK